MSATTLRQLTTEIVESRRREQATFLEMIDFLVNRVRRLESDVSSARTATDRALGCLSLARSQSKAKLS